MDEITYRQLREAAGGLFEDTPVLFAYLFGSRAVGRHRPDSDVDVAVYLETSVPSERFIDLSLSLAGRLAGVSRAPGIEVLVLNGAPLPVLGRVIGDRAILYSRDEPARVRFESRTLREFFDYEIHARPMNEKFLRDIAEGRR